MLGIRSAPSWGEQRREADAVAHHGRVAKLAAQRPDLDRSQQWPEDRSAVPSL
jgi:hypothetical protein